MVKDLSFLCGVTGLETAHGSALYAGYVQHSDVTFAFYKVKSLFLMAFGECKVEFVSVCDY